MCNIVWKKICVLSDKDVNSGANFGKTGAFGTECDGVFLNINKNLLHILFFPYL